MKKLTEVEVSRLWQRVAAVATALVTVDKQIVRVVYPGRPSDEPGADFKDAVVDIGGQLSRGDIEVHVRSSDWCMHRHHKNKTYNGIVLHVVMHHDTGEMTHLENGSRIPTVALENQIIPENDVSEIKSTKLCSAMKLRDTDSETVAGILDTAGEIRFCEKQSVFMHELTKTDAGQCLYSGIMSALGYSRNSVPFRILAQKLPLDFLEEVSGDSPEEMIPTRLQALFLGTAGFLPQQTGDSYFITAKDAWTLNLEEEWYGSGRRRELSPEDWHLFRVRPGNFPARRLVGMAYLLLRYRRQGLVAGLKQKIELTSQSEIWHFLENALVVTAEGYWAEHFGPGRQCRKLGRFLIGPSRAAEILVNIVFPFYAAYAACSSCPEIGQKTFELYCSYPVIMDNTIGRHMCLQLGMKPSQVNSARRQQGLLHLYKRFCTQGRCSECLLLV